ncbi:MAG TPA: sigma-54 dependent transcriptional regulator [archaeon]|nr:sigma-54 dependent transcriptional regulator [archaeon]
MGKKDKRRKVAFTFLGFQGGAAAALFLQKHSGSDVRITSQWKLLKHLSYITKENFDWVYILGVGVQASRYEIIQSVSRLTDQGIMVVWLHNYSGLEWLETQFHGNQYFNLVFKTGLGLPRLAAQYFGCTSKYSKKLVELAENEDARSGSLEYRLMGYAIFRYLDLRDLNVVPETICKLADPSRISPHDKEISERFQPPVGTRYVGESQKALELLNQVEKVAADSDCSVLITGETGTGKEVIARMIHRYSSPRSNYNFIPINCANLSESLLEDELFGHVKGAFTGAAGDKEGKLDLADKGTLFLDEVAEMSPRLQAKLLRVLDDGRFCRVGGREEESVDVRIIAATNQNLQQAVKEKKFREDLFYRLDVIRLQTPALRDRATDIPLIAEYFLREMSDRKEKKCKGLTKKQKRDLQQYTWPGNVRELRNVLERAMILDEWDFSTLLGSQMKPEGAGIGVAIDKERVTPIEEHELRYVMQVYQAFNGNKARSAKALGIVLNTLKKKLERAKELNIDGQ